MTLAINYPQESEDQLRSLFGANAEQAIKEAAAIELYRQTKISMGQLARMLGMGVIEADDWLAKRGVMIPMTKEDVEEEIATVKRFLRR